MREKEEVMKEVREEESPRGLQKVLAVTLNKTVLMRVFRKRMIWLACYGSVLAVSGRAGCMGEQKGAVYPVPF